MHKKPVYKTTGFFEQRETRTPLRYVCVANSFALPRSTILYFAAMLLMFTFRVVLSLYGLTSR